MGHKIEDREKQRGRCTDREHRGCNSVDGFRKRREWERKKREGEGASGEGGGG